MTKQEMRDIYYLDKHGDQFGEWEREFIGDLADLNCCVALSDKQLEMISKLVDEVDE